MRYGIALTAALIIVPTTDVRSQQWCGYFGRPHSLIQCGYSTLDACKIAIGTDKDAMCYVNPVETLNNRGRTHFFAGKHRVGRVLITQKSLSD
jgi:hypothetical protein